MRISNRILAPLAVAFSVLLILLPLSTSSAKEKSENGEAKVTICHTNGHRDDFLMINSMGNSVNTERECFGRVVTIGLSGLNGHKVEDDDGDKEPV